MEEQKSLLNELLEGNRYPANCGASERMEWHHGFIGRRELVGKRVVEVVCKSAYGEYSEYAELPAERSLEDVRAAFVAAGDHYQGLRFVLHEPLAGRDANKEPAEIYTMIDDESGEEEIAESGDMAFVREQAAVFARELHGCTFGWAVTAHIHIKRNGEPIETVSVVVEPEKID